MGLINTSHKDTIRSISNFQSDLLKNPYYLFNDKRAHIVEYYNFNKEMSTLDDALRIEYSNFGKNCPIRYNVIHNMYLYGLERIGVSLENGDFGLESGEISGNALILPHTIQPYPGDYFTINTVSKKYLFKVIEVQADTFDNGGNYWTINYKLDRNDDRDIKDLVVEEYEFYEGNVGSAYNPIIKKTKWDLAKRLDDLLVILIKHYKSLFYNNKVQTYTYSNKLLRLSSGKADTEYLYDPYLIEFIKDNKILNNDGDKYIYIGRATRLHHSFSIRYAKSIWAILESKELDNLDGCTISSYAKYIDDKSTIFQTRYEDYFELLYETKPSHIDNRQLVQILDPQVIGHIKENQLFEYDNYNSRYNILIKYMNNSKLTIDDIICFEKIDEDYMYDDSNYFLIPMIIYCIKYYINNIIK